MLDKLYKNRFGIEEIQERNRIWKVLCSSFLQKYISKNFVVLDIGAGYAEFINNIQCKEKYAVDLNEDTRYFLKAEVKFFKAPSTNLSFLQDNSMDVVFMSNFLEHLETKQELVKTFLEIIRILKVDGRLIILGPNIRYVGKEYWDFFDHYIPLNDKSLVEALQMTGFRIDQVLSKFLPYTTKSKIPKNAFLFKIYLKMPLIWKIMGRQMLIISRKPCLHNKEKGKEKKGCQTTR